MFVLFLLHILLLSLLPSVTLSCRSLHSKSHGVEISCCSSSSPLPDNCEFSSKCATECSCQLILTSRLECSSQTSKSQFEWRNHGPSSGDLRCDQPNVPNQGSPYHLIVQGWNNKTESFLFGLCGTSVTKGFIDAPSNARFPDFGSCFPKLESIDISLSDTTSKNLSRKLNSLKYLKSIRTIRIDFDLPVAIPSWGEALEYLHVENSSMSELPKWLSLSKNLTRIAIKYTNISSIATVSQLKSLRSVRLPHNQIEDLHRFSLSTPEIFDLDLSHNKISSLAMFTFSQCVELRVLDLSHNPLTHLPFRPFIRNTRLKWLKLTDTHIKTLSADHFFGLSSLRTLSLSRCPLQSIAPFSFLPLKGLRSLDLQSCNLTRIPAAVTHNCALTHLNVANNLLHRSSSLPPEVIAMLSSLSQFKIDDNPLTEFPPSLLLLAPENVRLYRQLVLTTTQLPMWTKEPCTPYFWHLHLKNRSLSLRQLVSPWDEKRMVREGLGHCQEQFDWMTEQMTLYRDLERSSGCSVSRRLRSSIQRVSSCNSSSPTPSRLAPSLPLPLPSSTLSTPLLLASLAVNIFFVFIIVAFICLLWNCGKRPYH